MLESLSTAVIALDGDLAVRYMNPAAEALFAVGARTVEGRPVTAWLPGAVDLASRLRTSAADGQPWTARELSLALAGGAQPVTVDLAVTPLDDGLLLEFTGLDRHLRISREEHLHAQHEAGRALVRGLAHEIKNPLGGVRGAAQLLERRLDDAGLREYTRLIIVETDRLAALVDALLGPANPPRREPVSVHELTERVLALIESETGVVVRREYDPSLPPVEVDADQIVQALLNLARNATQVSDTVTVRTRVERQVTLAGVRHRQAACIEVIDGGPGIPPALIEQVFLPLVTTRPGGTGLGLPIAQSLTMRHGGLIECESAPGRTVFTMLLPLPENAHDR